MRPQAQRVIQQFLVPVASVVIATVVTLNVHALQNKSSLLIFLGAVVLSTRVGGWSAGLAATLMSAAAIPYFLLEPISKFSISDPNDLMRLIVFVLVSLMILTLHAARSRAEMNLRASEQRLSLAIDAAHMGVWDYNLLTRKFWWTKTLEQIYGRANKDFASTYGRFFAYIHFDDQPRFNRAITRTIDEGTDYEVDHRIVLPDDSIRWVNTRGRVFFNENNRAERIVGLTIDITAKKKFEMGPMITGSEPEHAEKTKLSTVA
jgi:PAS domain-containing protein